jgi:hypothetical protein
MKGSLRFGDGSLWPKRFLTLPIFVFSGQRCPARPRILTHMGLTPAVVAEGALTSASVFAPRRKVEPHAFGIPSSRCHR